MTETPDRRSASAIVLAALILGATVANLNMAAANVALPTIGEDIQGHVAGMLRSGTQRFARRPSAASRSLSAEKTPTSPYGSDATSDPSGAITPVIDPWSVAATLDAAM